MQSIPGSNQCYFFLNDEAGSLRTSRLDQASCTTVCVHCGMGCVLVLFSKVWSGGIGWWFTPILFLRPRTQPDHINIVITESFFRIPWKETPKKKKKTLQNGMYNVQCTAGKHYKMTYWGWRRENDLQYVWLFPYNMEWVHNNPQKKSKKYDQPDDLEAFLVFLMLLCHFHGCLYFFAADVRKGCLLQRRRA